ncbi:MAG TPA: hypothetical protein VGJ02_03090, partial [Pyrinomonadaceae bacterium]
MGLHEIFVGSDGRLRSGWRCAIFAAGFSILTAILVMIGSVSAGPDLLHGPNGLLIDLTIENISILISALFVGWLCNRFLDGSSFSEMGASFNRVYLKHLGSGLALGTITLCLAVGIA